MSPIKIGMTNSSNLNSRVNDYKTSSPYGIELIGFIQTPTPSQMESKLHGLLKDVRLKGEWFDIDKFQANELINMYNPEIDERKKIKFNIPFNFDYKDYYVNELKMFKCFFDNLPFEKPVSFDVKKWIILLKKYTDIPRDEITEQNVSNSFDEYYRLSGE